MFLLRNRLLFVSRRSARQALTQKLEITLPKPTYGRLSHRANAYREIKAVTVPALKKAVGVAPAHPLLIGSGARKISQATKLGDGACNFWLGQTPELYTKKRRYPELSYG